jgi:hypothetical protein
LVRKFLAKYPYGITIRRWEDGFKMYFREICYEDVR